MFNDYKLQHWYVWKPCQVLPSDLFGWFKWPFQGLSDLHLGDQKVTWKKLEIGTLPLILYIHHTSPLQKGCFQPHRLHPSNSHKPWDSLLKNGIDPSGDCYWVGSSSKGCWFSVSIFFEQPELREIGRVNQLTAAPCFVPSSQRNAWSPLHLALRTWMVSLNWNILTLDG